MGYGAVVDALCPDPVSVSEFNQEMRQRLAALREQGLYRELSRFGSPQSSRITLDGETFLNFSSNDYLGLANEPALRLAATEAIESFGAGSGASRLISGSLAPHHELEEALAAFKGTEAALSFSSGYTTALGAIGALLGQQDVIILDKLVHASIVDAARLSRATLRVFSHHDLDDLEAILKWTSKRTSGARSALEAPRGRALIVTESVFSMEGDHAPLRAMVDLKDKYGAWLMVDEAHATGLYGANRRGLTEELDLSDRIEVQMGTLGKALGASGGYICGSRVLIEYLLNRARPFIFSTAPVPAAVAAAAAGVRFVQSPEGATRRQLLWERVAQLSDVLHGNGRRSEQPNRSAILPILVGEENKAVETSTALRKRGIFVPAVRYPTVGRGAARLRVTLTAAHTRQEVQELAAALQALGLGPAIHRPSLPSFATDT